MGNIYPQLSLEKRTMIHPQLERGIKLAAIAVGLNRFAIDAVSRTSSKRLGSPVRASVALDVLRWQAVTVSIRPRRRPGLSCIAHRLRPAALWD